MATTTILFLVDVIPTTQATPTTYTTTRVATTQDTTNPATTILDTTTQTATTQDTTTQAATIIQDITTQAATTQDITTQAAVYPATGTTNSASTTSDTTTQVATTTQTVIAPDTTTQMTVQGTTTQGTSTIQVQVRFWFMSNDNSNFFLSCNSTGGLAKSVVWTRDGFLLHNTSPLVLTDNSTYSYTNVLMVSDRTPGTYTCTIRGPNDQSLSSANFIVQGT